MTCNQEREKPQQERWGAAAIKADWCCCEVENVWARSGTAVLPVMSFYSSKTPPASYKRMQNTELFVVFLTVKQRKPGGTWQKYCLQYILKIKKAHVAEIWLMSFLSVRILCTHDTGLPIQLRGNKDWSLQLIIFVIGCHEKMGPNYPSKCLVFYVAFTALSILIVFHCYFTSTVLKKVDVDYNCCLDWKNYPAWLL